MKIVYYIPSLYIPGGLERIITFKANYFADHFDNYSIVILTSEQMGKPLHFKLSKNVRHVDLNVPFDNVKYRSNNFKLISYPFKYYRFKRRFKEFLYDFKPDIVISTLRREINFINSIQDGSVKIGEFHVTRYVYHVSTILSKSPLYSLSRSAWEKVFIKNLKKLSKLVLLTQEEASYWPELSNTTVIYNPIPFFSNKISDCSSREAIAVGRYVPQKGFDLLIKSWKIVSERHPDWILRIYGDGMREELSRQIHDLGLEKSCILEYPTSDITDKYCESSIFILSSRYEGFGMVITEAMSCGLPVVSFNCHCGPKEIINDGIDGLLVSNGDVQEMAEKICYLIEHEDIRKQMGKQGRIDAERFKIENIAGQWKELFESLSYNNQGHSTLL